MSFFVLLIIICFVFFLHPQGIEKKSGKPVAIKEFSLTSESDIKHEANMLKIAVHKNVVQLFALERQITDIMPGLVIVMEYCENNLSGMIKESQNGFNEMEFRNFSDQIVQAVQHLHSLKMCHRDIKPENTLVSNISGQFIYKLGDFGAARILEPEEKFDSIHGTYEYIHPKMFATNFYQQLNIPKPTEKFDATSDFWSVGATLIHAATGRLPFSPLNRRANPKRMYEMISKGNGVIMATENESGITYSRKLPKGNVNKAVEPFLKKLLNVSFVIFFAYL